MQDKLQHGYRIGKQYCYEMTNIIKYWTEFFSEAETVKELTTKMLQNFEKFLRERRTEKVNKGTGEKVTVQLSTTTMNNIMKCGSIALGWAVQTKMIELNPCKGLTAYSIKNKKRGILSPEEAETLFHFGNWKDERSRVASLVAMTCGLRIGEILALHENDIGTNMLYVRHSWSVKGKLGPVKNGEERMVPLLPSVRRALLQLALQNPHKESDSRFIFWGDLPNQPVVQNVVTDDFRDMLKSIDITEVERKSRNIVFHSWRHYYATVIVKRVELGQAQQALGHLSPEMTKMYADHKTAKDLAVVEQAVQDAFKDVLPCTGTA